MSNLREIQSRMKSIRDTMKITNAMFMISSSKLQKAKRDLKNTEPYFYTVQETLAKILHVAPDAGNQFFDIRNDVSDHEKKQGYLVITADKGMAGAYNHNVIKIAEQEAASDNDNMLFVVGQVGRQYFEKKNIPIDINFHYTAQNPNMNRARYISTKMIELFIEKKLDEVYIVFTQMTNSVNFETRVRQLLPLKEEKIIMREAERHYEQVAFLPDPNTVFDNIVPNYVAGFIYGALVESYCSEHNARMMAMQTATGAAQDMLKGLKIEYNRARQAAITQEITEVIAGAKALRNAD